VLHPGATAIAALYLFDVEPYAAGGMIAAASLPVAGTVFMLTQHFGVLPQRAATAILRSIRGTVLTVTGVIAFGTR
jgi:malonate transporter and related proteins